MQKGKIKVMSVFGTRPEATKMGPIIKALENDAAFESVVCVSAQHRDMLDEVLEIFDIKPRYDLNIMKEGQSLEYITTAALNGICGVIDKENPDILLAHGDTTTTFASSLAAFYRGIKLGHVEAGLRTGDKMRPYPEEINRKLTGVLADIHFAPTEKACDNLRSENIKSKDIFITGNTAVDCVKNSFKENYCFKRDILNSLDFDNKKIIMVTAHRRESLGEPLENICAALLDIVRENRDVSVIYPVHPNPVVRNTVYSMLDGVDGIYLTEPLNFVDMHNLMARSFVILTDSGGIQEEAPAFSKPVLVLRETTERPEGLSAGTLKLAGCNRKNIVEMTNELLNDPLMYRQMTAGKNPFGDGFASHRILEVMKYYFSIRQDRPKDFC